jgi:hypothetical protein
VNNKSNRIARLAEDIISKQDSQRPKQDKDPQVF